MSKLGYDLGNFFLRMYHPFSILLQHVSWFVRSRILNNFKRCDSSEHVFYSDADEKIRCLNCYNFIR